MYIPKMVFLTKGVGKHKEKLSSFEMALRQARIAHLNLVKVSSIFPPRCKLISMEEGLTLVNPGQIVHAVMSENATCEPNRLVAASVGVAIPRDPKRYGYLSEHHCFGKEEAEVGEYTEDLAASMLATILDVQFDPELSYDEKKEVWDLDGAIIRSTNITKTAVGDKKGLWTTVIAAAVFAPNTEDG